MVLEVSAEDILNEIADDIDAMMGYPHPRANISLPFFL